MVLQKKWYDNGFKFHLIQLILFLSLLITLILMFNVEPAIYGPVLPAEEGEEPTGSMLRVSMSIASFILTIYFMLFEVVQVIVQGREYLNFNNMVDVVRILFTF